MKQTKIIKEFSKISEYKINISIISFYAYIQKQSKGIMKEKTLRNVPNLPEENFKALIKDT